jgi:hypothetical protein
MNKTIIIFMSLVIASCAVPNKIELESFSEDLSCILPKEKMYIYMAFDRCPVLSDKPVPKATYWNLRKLDELSPLKDLSSDDKVEVLKNCAIGAESVQRFLINTDSRLFVDSIVLRSDSVSSNRLLIYGKTNHQDRELNWIFDSRKNMELEILDRIKADFNICKPVE